MLLAVLLLVEPVLRNQHTPQQLTSVTLLLHRSQQHHGIIIFDVKVDGLARLVDEAPQCSTQQGQVVVGQVVNILQPL